jgi:hypothetical protein
MPAESKRANLSMQVPIELLERIDANALVQTAGNRTQYILSWLPETYDQPTADGETRQDKATTGRR